MHLLKKNPEAAAPPRVTSMSPIMAKYKGKIATLS